MSDDDKLTHELINRLLDEGHLPPADMDQLQRALARSTEARRQYLELVQLHCLLDEHYLEVPGGTEAGAMMPDVTGLRAETLRPDVNGSPNPSVETGHLLPPLNHAFSWGRNLTLFLLLLSAAGVWAWSYRRRASDKSDTSLQANSKTATESVATAAPRAQELEAVARVVRRDNARWAGDMPELPLGCWLPPGRMELQSGTVVLAFNKGAELTLIGPATVQLVGNDLCELLHGSASAFVPESAKGFMVRTSAAEIRDLGTRFAVEVRSPEDCRVGVVEGAVELKNAEQTDWQRLSERQSLLVSASGLTPDQSTWLEEWLDYSPLEAELGDVPIEYYHWSFDDHESSELGQVVWSETGWHPGETNYPAETLHMDQEQRGGEVIADRTGWDHVSGQFGSALQLHGNGAFLRTAMAGIGGDRPRTVSFWVRVAEQAPRMSSYSMIAWGDWQKPGGKWQIGWNPNLQVGSGRLGAIRTEVSHGYVVGSTDIRDGRWHHVASVYLGGSYTDIRHKFRLYIDGQLEDFSSHWNTPVDSQRNLDFPVEIGRYIGAIPNLQTFQGDLDELYLFDGALTPAQIRRLYHENQPPRPREIIPTIFYAARSQ